MFGHIVREGLWINIYLDRGTGELLDMDDLFTVERSLYMKRLTGPFTNMVK